MYVTYPPSLPPFACPPHAHFAHLEYTHTHTHIGCCTGLATLLLSQDPPRAQEVRYKLLRGRGSAPACIYEHHDGWLDRLNLPHMLHAALDTVHMVGATPQPTSVP